MSESTENSKNTTNIILIVLIVLLLLGGIFYLVSANNATPAEEPAQPTALPEGAVTCELVSQNPTDNTSFNAGDTFDMAWEIKNVGEATWTISEALIVKTAALNDHYLSTVGDLNLTSDVATGETYTVNVAMTAPDTAGKFGENWILTMNDQTVCYFYIVIQVAE